MYAHQSALLRYEQEQELGNILSESQCLEDRNRARQMLILANVGLVGALARKYQNTELSYDDLLQEGTIGLINAVDRFEPCRGFRFSTYALPWIKQSIIRAITERGRTIRVPAPVHANLRRLLQANERLNEKLGRPATPEELAQEIGMPEHKVSHLIRTAITSLTTVSLDAPVGQEQDTRMADLIPAPDSDPLKMATSQDTRKVILEALESLTKDEQKLLIARYGLNGDDPCTLEQLSQTMKRSRERLRQIEVKALQKLRRHATLRSFAPGISS